MLRLPTQLTALALCSSLAVVTTTARAKPLAKLPLFISDTIAADSASAQAAAKFANTSSIKAFIQTRAFSSNAAHLPGTGLVLAPIQQWQQTIPTLSVLRLPFYYPNLPAVHAALDGKLGKRLAQRARTNGWKLLAVWDDGMTDFSGNQEYTKLLNLSGMQFALWQPDPLQALELKALNTWSRVIRKNGLQRNAQQCIVDSRSTTPTQMLREHLQRIHLDVTLTQDRYAGYALAVPLHLWQKLSSSQHAYIQKTLAHITAWERKQALRQQQQALSTLHHAGMQLHRLSQSQRRLFILRMPPWRDFLKQLDPKTADDLLAAARAAATTGRRSTHKEATINSLPATEAAK